MGRCGELVSTRTLRVSRLYSRTRSGPTAWQRRHRQCPGLRRRTTPRIPVEASAGSELKERRHKLALFHSADGSMSISSTLQKPN